MTDFEKEITAAINRHSMEHESNTPDFILSRFLVSCLGSFNMAVARREDLCNSKHPKETAAIRSTVWAAAKKLVDTFPETMPDEPTKFNIPAYIVQELRDALDAEQQDHSP